MFTKSKNEPRRHTFIDGSHGFSQPHIFQVFLGARE
jgi:hypothetical protein